MRTRPLLALSWLHCSLLNMKSLSRQLSFARSTATQGACMPRLPAAWTSTVRHFCSSPHPHRPASINRSNAPSGKATGSNEGLNSSAPSGEADIEETDLQVHKNFLKNVFMEQEEGEKGEGVGEEGGGEEGAGRLLLRLQHPLLRKYNFDLTEFCIGATAAIHSLFQALQEAADEGGGAARAADSLLEDTCSSQARETLRQVMRGGVAVDDIHSRMEGDLRWFSKFGFQLEHKLVVLQRHLAFAFVQNVQLHLSQSRSPTDENIWGEQGGISEGEDSQRRHVLAVVDMIYQLRSDAVLNYSLPGPPPYHLKVCYSPYCCLSNTCRHVYSPISPIHIFTLALLTHTGYERRVAGPAASPLHRLSL